MNRHSLPSGEAATPVSNLDRIPHAGATLRLPFDFDDRTEVTVHLGEATGKRAIEDDEFPFEALSDIAERESWRKEIYRPTTYISKWWARRLGTVFRAIAIGAFAESGTNVLDLFYQSTRIPDRVVFDPFMGSGTTLTEVVKLGARAVGRDINPVAHCLARCALSAHDRQSVLDTFRAIEIDVSERIRSYHRTILENRQVAEVLYWFWVMVAQCPHCSASVDLFSSRIFARHSNPRKFPKAHAVCPSCSSINTVDVRDTRTRCSSCPTEFDLGSGPARGATASCPHCSHSFPIARTIRETGQPPSHRLYAKLVLLPDGRKAYVAATDEDRRLYRQAERELAAMEGPYPVVSIRPGYNTNQAINYGYRRWHELFNARQLLCLAILGGRIGQLKSRPLRDLFTCLLSGTLEFHSMLCSYKGEGTGAVRHAFSHHILKPERTPLEANPWGTKGSGAFSTLFASRILRALDYAENPFELRLVPNGRKPKSAKVFGLSERIGSRIDESFDGFADRCRVSVSCGDSGATNLPARVMDAVLTDPPFFDNVHYSELADYFHVWQRHILGADGCRRQDTTRSDHEVQATETRDFAGRLTRVWTETARVLKDGGLLVFTYHHSRHEGWRSILQALMDAGFGITAAHPIKSEMAVAVPKLKAREPINLDIILVCRKRTRLKVRSRDEGLWDAVSAVAEDQVGRLRRAGRRMSRNDVRVIVMAQLLRRLSVTDTVENALVCLDDACGWTDRLIERLHAEQRSPIAVDGSSGQ